MGPSGLLWRRFVGFSKPLFLGVPWFGGGRVADRGRAGLVIATRLSCVNFALVLAGGSAAWRGCGAAGSAPHWQCGGQGFESPQLHSLEGPELLGWRVLRASGEQDQQRSSPQIVRMRSLNVDL